jgi:hypothetical protein
MVKKYFNYQGAPWQIIETPDPWGTPMVYAIEMDSTDGAMLNTEQYSHASDWEYVEASAVRIDKWFLRSDPNDLFEAEGLVEEGALEDEDQWAESSSGVSLKEMLERLNNQPKDGPSRRWSIQDDDMNRHERLKASLDESKSTIGNAEDILGMIRARQQETVEMPHTVILNESKYTDPSSLEKAIREMKKQHGDNAHIRIGKHDAEDLLASMQNQERIGLSSIMDPTQGISVDFDAETLELIKKMKPKK